MSGVGKLASAFGRDVELMVTSDWHLPSHARHRRVKTVLAGVLRAGGVARQAGPGQATTASRAAEPAVRTADDGVARHLASQRNQLLLELHSNLGHLRSDLLELSLMAGSVKGLVEEAGDLRAELSRVQRGLDAAQEQLRAVADRATQTAGELSSIDTRQHLFDGWDRWRLDALEAKVDRALAWLLDVPLAGPTGVVLLQDKGKRTVTATAHGSLEFEVSDVSVVHSDAGPMLVPCTDAQIAPAIARDGNWSVVEARAVLEGAASGGTFLDIGAHTGYFSLLVASTSPDVHVVAVEADPDLAELVRRNAQVNGRDITVLPLAAMDRDGPAFLSAESEGNPGDQRVYQDAGGDRVGKWVRAARLDDELADLRNPLCVVKTDCQGRDHLALRGLEATLRRDRPRVVAEFWPAAIRQVGDDPLEVLYWYMSLGYDVTILDPDAREVDTAQDMVRAAEELAGGAATLLCVPRVRDQDPCAASA